VSAGSLRTTISGLANGQTYVVSVAARNAAGVGPRTASAPFVPNPALSAPTDVVARASPNGSVSISWHGITRTIHGAVRFTVTAGGQTVAQTSGTQAVANGLTVGQSYRFTVAATDGSATKSASSGPVIPYKPAAAPGGLTPTPGKSQIALSWTAPALNGGKLVGYVVSGGGADRTVSATSTTITGLTTGTTYTFSVHAVTQDPNGSGTKVTGAAASVSAKAIAPPVVTINDWKIPDNNTLVLHVTVDDGGADATCAVTFLGFPAWSGGCANGQDTITVTINTGDDTNVPVTVTGTNAAGKGPTATVLVSTSGSGGNSGSSLPPGRVQRKRRWIYATG